MLIFFSMTDLNLPYMKYLRSAALAVKNCCKGVGEFNRSYFREIYYLLTATGITSMAEQNY